jgi:hypothetical protein
MEYNGDLPWSFGATLVDAIMVLEDTVSPKPIPQSVVNPSNFAASSSLNDSVVNNPHPNSIVQEPKKIISIAIGFLALTAPLKMLPIATVLSNGSIITPACDALLPPTIWILSGTM